MDKIIKNIISFILCVILFTTEIILLVQYNLNKGITKQDITKIINSIDIEEEIKKMDNYDKLEIILKKEALREIVNSDELEKYVKENAKGMIFKFRFGEEFSYSSDQELKEFINNKTNELQELNEITENNKEEIIKIIDEMTKDIENKVEQMNKTNTNIVVNILSNKMTMYLLLAVILISLLIILINQSKQGLIFIGLPTIMTGIIFFMMYLSITGTINARTIDKEVMRTVKTYLPNLLKTLRKSSIIMTMTGFIECALYKTLYKKEVGTNNGEI